MKSKKDILLELLQNAITITENKISKFNKKQKKSELLEMLILTLKNLKNLKNNFISGKIRENSQGATLGLTRNIGEFCNDDLYEIATKIDDFYSKEMNKNKNRKIKK